MVRDLGANAEWSCVIDVEWARGLCLLLGGEGDVSTASLVGGGISFWVRGDGDLVDFVGEVLVGVEWLLPLRACIWAVSTDSNKSNNGFRGSIERDILEDCNSLPSVQIECLALGAPGGKRRRGGPRSLCSSLGSTQTEYLVLALLATGGSLGPSYNENLDLGAPSPTIGRRGEDGRGHAPRREGDEANEEEPPDPEIRFQLLLISLK